MYELGAPIAIAYRRARDGKTYRHDFGSKVKLYATLDGSALVIAGGKLRVSDYIRG